MEHSIEVLAVPASISNLMAFSDAAERELPLTIEQGYFLRLAIEEIATNLIKYGYAHMLPGPIQVCCAYEHGRLRLVLRDRGRPFDPREAPPPDLSGDIRSRAVGGLGIFLVRQLADELLYHHDAASGWNELVVLKGAEDGVA